MSELDDLIRFENENTSLDFKAVQYLKTSHEALIKDIMAMANANVSGDRYIIVGVKHRPDGTREYLSIDDKEFVDSAIYHQLLRENVEPEIHFDYLPYSFEGSLLGVFRIYDCVNQPYMMRKAFGTGLRQGDAFTRKGSHQTRLMRQDLDRIFLKRGESGFTGVIRIGFDDPRGLKEVTLSAADKIILPSDLAAKKIRSILAEREQPDRGELMRIQRMFESGLIRSSIFGPTSYAQRSTEELRENLEHVKDTYRDDDLHELYEVKGTKINLLIVNEGETYVEDTSIKVDIPKLEGLRVARRIYPKPVRSSNPFEAITARPFMYGHNYPKVRNLVKHVEVRSSIGNLRHGIPTLAFDEPIRIVIENNLIGQKILLGCTLYGKQLRAPRTETLTINVIEPIAHGE